MLVVSDSNISSNKGKFKMIDKNEYPGKEARLFPVASPTRKEQRQTSVLLAVLVAIPELAKQLLESIGEKTGPQSSIKTFTEVEFKGKHATKDKPDGLIVVARSKNNVWHALLEVKIGNSKLDADQIERYLKIARTQKLDAVITVSNQLVARPDHNPVKVKNRPSKVALFHWSWKFIQTEAKLLQFRDVFDKRPCEAYILEEFIRFLGDKSVGVSGIDGMPRQSWSKLIKTATNRGVIRKNLPELQDVVSAWYSEVRDLQLQLCQRLRLPPDKVEVTMERVHISDPKKRLEYGCRHLVDTNELEAEFEIENVASDLKVVVNIAHKVIFISMSLEAPGDKKTGSGRVNWLLRQFKNKEVHTGNLSVRIYFCDNSQEDYPLKKLISDNYSTDFNDLPLPKKFDIISVYNDQKKFSNHKDFIKVLEKSVLGFYDNIGCHLKKWTPPAPTPIPDESQTEE